MFSFSQQNIYLAQQFLISDIHKRTLHFDTTCAGYKNSFNTMIMLSFSQQKFLISDILKMTLHFDTTCAKNKYTASKLKKVWFSWLLFHHKLLFKLLNKFHLHLCAIHCQFCVVFNFSNFKIFYFSSQKYRCVLIQEPAKPWPSPA